MRKILMVGIVIAFLGPFAFAQTGDCTDQLPGCLDISFGLGGKAAAPTGMNIDAIAIQNIVINVITGETEPRIIAAGTISVVTRKKTTRQWIIARFKANGTLDTSFGAGSGKVQTAFPYGDGYVHALTVQPWDNKLVVGGSGYLLKSHASAPSGVPVVARYLPNGELDTTFGTGGMTGVPYGRHVGGVTAVALQSDHKIVATGCYIYTCRMGVFRLNSTGKLDTSFNSKGTVPGIYVYENAQSNGNAVAVQSVGTEERVVVAGFLTKPTIWRFTSSGIPDAGNFGPQGLIETEYPGYGGEYKSLAVVTGPGSSVGILAAGDSGGGSPLFLARYLENGDLDASFGIGGKVLSQSQLNYDIVNAMAIQPDGKILLSGYSDQEIGQSFKYYPANWRFDNGQLDASFRGGWVTTDLQPVTRVFYSVAQHGVGKFVAAGEGLLVRYFE